MEGIEREKRKRETGQGQPTPQQEGGLLAPPTTLGERVEACRNWLRDAGSRADRLGVEQASATLVSLEGKEAAATWMAALLEETAGTTAAATSG